MLKVVYYPVNFAIHNVKYLYIKIKVYINDVYKFLTFLHEDRKYRQWSQKKADPDPIKQSRILYPLIKEYDEYIRCGSIWLMAITGRIMDH